MKYNVFLLVLVVLMSCADKEARRPKTHTTTNFYKEVLKENKKLNKIEERNIKLVLSKDTIYNYQESSNGFWYTYIKKDTLNSSRPKTNDLVIIRFDIKDIFNTVIYKEKEIEYKVGKENFITGLSDGIRMMKKGEQMNFIIPSYRAYGVTGDGNKIQMNKTLKSSVTLIDIKQNKNENN